MRICVFGAGAVGGHFAVRLARAGNDVSVVARGEHLDAIRQRGLTLKAGEEETSASVRASSNAAELGEQDVVLVTLKTTSLPGLVPAIAPLLVDATSVVFAQNGIPWWYRIEAPRTFATAPDLMWMDPGGELASLGHRVLGGVIYSANEVIAPGVVHNSSAKSNRLIIGELDHRQSGRVCDLRATLEAAGLASPDTGSIRQTVWSKLVLNLSSSLLAAAAGVPAAELRRDPAFEAIFQRLHAEGCAIAQAYCEDFQPSEPMKPRAGHKPSILQDYERGRPMEIDALVTAPLAFARAARIATPSLDMLGALIVDKAVRAGLYVPARPLPIGI